MIDVGAAARELLMQAVPVTQMTGTRVFSDMLPQGAKTPAIVYAVTGEIANDVLGGPLGMEQASIQMLCYGATRSEANSLHFNVKQTLAGFRGIVAGVTIREVSQDSGLNYDVDLPQDGSDSYRYITAQDFGFVYGSLERSC